MLADAGAPYAGVARWAVIAAAVAAVSSVLLPGVSGWFLAGAAMAGAIAGLLLALAAGPWAALALLAVLLLLPFATSRLAPALLDARARRAADAAGRLKQALVEQLPASDEIAAFGLEDAAATAMGPLAAELDAARLELARAEARLGALAVVAGGVALAAMLLVARGGPPAIMLALLGAAGAVEAIGGLSRSVARERAVRAAMDRILLLAGDPPEGGIAVRGETIRIGAESFGPGARIAVCGVSGSGKTRLLETLAGIRPAAGADLAVDDVPLEACDRESLRALFAVAPQGAELLAGTVRDNLAIARPGLPEAAMWEALELACLADDVRAMAGGLDHWLGDGGARLSGGQRKRLALARAAAAGRRWLVLDEPTEGLDAGLEAQLVARLDDWLTQTGSGLLLASHRTAPLALCDHRISLS